MLKNDNEIACGTQAISLSKAIKFITPPPRNPLGKHRGR